MPCASSFHWIRNSSRLKSTVETVYIVRCIVSMYFSKTVDVFVHIELIKSLDQKLVNLITPFRLTPSCLRNKSWKSRTHTSNIHDSFHRICYIHGIEKSRFLSISRYKFKLSCLFNLNFDRGICVCRFDGIRGRISSDIWHVFVYIFVNVCVRVCSCERWRLTNTDENCRTYKGIM